MGYLGNMTDVYQNLKDGLESEKQENIAKGEI